MRLRLNCHTEASQEKYHASRRTESSKSLNLWACWADPTEMKPRLLIKGLRSSFHEIKDILQAWWAPFSRLSTEAPGDTRPGFLSIIERISAGTQARLECCSVTHRRRMLIESYSQWASVLLPVELQSLFQAQSPQSPTGRHVDGAEIMFTESAVQNCRFQWNFEHKEEKDFVVPWLRGRGI